MQKNGVMIMSGFAAIWFLWGLSAAGPMSVLWMLAPLGISAGMIALAARMPVTVNPARRAAIGRFVGLASAIEGVAILVAVNAVAWAGYPSFGVCAVLAIVGLHFFPLAKFLPAGIYMWTGSAMVALAAAGVAIPGDQTRLLVLGVGAALFLWATCLVILMKPRQAPLATA